MMKWSVLVLIALGAVGWVASAPGTTRTRNPRSTFLNIVGEKPSESYPAPLLPVELPIKLGGYGGVNLPVLVLPVPVFTKSDTCEVHNNKEVPVEHEKGPTNLPYAESHPQFKDVPNTPSPTVSQPIPYYPEPSHKPVNDYGPPSTNAPQHPPKDEVHYHTSPPQNPHYYQPVQKPTVHQPPASLPQPVHNEVEPAPEEQPIPYSQGRDQLFANSDDLIQSYRQQYRGQPGAPAVVPVGRRLPARLQPAGPDAVPGQSVFGKEPPRPNFDRSLRLRIDLRVPRAGYTEAFEIEWDAKSNTARTVVEDGSTIIYRVPLLDGRVQFLEMAVDRTNGTAVRRCTMSPIQPASPDDKRFPGLPNLDSFYFFGFTSAEGQSRVERWHKFVIGKPGESGAAPGESLNFTHHMLIYRDGGDAVPLTYTVKQSSSVLGPNIDGYTHRYEVLSAPTGPILPDPSHECDVIVQLEEKKHRQRRQLRNIFTAGVSNLASTTFDAATRFNPLKGFLGPTTDPSHDSEFNEFKNKFQRTYRDDKEHSVRKSQFINTKRFVNAANRVASSFKTGVNYFADRVVEETNWLFGVAPEPEETPPGLAAPDLSYSEILKIHETLPEDFDKWREDGGVSPVRHQGQCMSCWAFAVTGSTEGALFKKTKKLVPLSPQSLVDCGAEYKMNGCKESWPMYGYTYIKDRGIPAWESYDYKAEVQECKKIEPVTRISGYRNVSNTLEGVKVAIFKNAPTVVLIGGNLNSFINYDGVGLYEDAMCMGHEHAVLAVGWGSKGGSHLILKNSWGTGWGQNGYVTMNPEVCSVTDIPSYAIVEKSDIVREDLRSSAQDR